MSERSTFVSGLFYDRARAEAVANHLSPQAATTATVIQVSANKWFVAGYINCSAPGMEWELLSTLSPLPGAGKLVINSESAAPIWWDMETATHAAS